MDSVKEQMAQWNVYGDAVPSEEQNGNPMHDLSLPTNGLLSQRSPDSHRSSSLSAGIFSTAMLLNILRFLRPSFMQARSSGKPVKIYPTTYLNGVRGFAAMCVYFQHYLVKYFMFLDKGYGSTPEDFRILQLPYIRLMFTGRFMVTNFFILSGFVLSAKPLRLIRKRDASLLDCLASSVFRRAPRLFLPLAPPMVVSAFCVYFHVYHPKPVMPAIDPNHVYPSLLARLNDEYNSYIQLLNPFTWGQSHPQNTPHMWTLPMEFRGSMIVFLALLMLCKAKPAIRMITLAGFAWYCLQMTHWDTFLFVSGILLAEYHIIQQENSYSLDDLLRLLNVPTTKKGTSALSPVFWSLVFALGLFIGSWPCERAATTPGLISALDSLTPGRYHSEEEHGYFWYSLAAVMIMLSFENFPTLQRPFNTPIARYLGDISFAFYIIHWTFLWTVGRMITNETMAMFGTYFGWTIGAIICFPMTICIADVYWRVFDNGAVDLARWLWDKCSVSDLPRAEHLGNGIAH